MGISHLQQAEAGVLSLEIQPPRRPLSALWRQDRAAGEDDAIHVVGFSTCHCERSEAIQNPSAAKVWIASLALAMTERMNAGGNISDGHIRFRRRGRGLRRLRGGGAAVGGCGDIRGAARCRRTER